MPPAARISDMHVCPMVTGVVPHVGGPILPPCAPTVLTGGLPQARVGDMLTCVGPPDAIAKGSAGVFVMGQPAARMFDMTAHGGVIVLGLPTVMIGEVGMGAVPPPDVSVLAPGLPVMPVESSGGDAAKMADVLIAGHQTGKPFCEQCQKAMG